MTAEPCDELRRMERFAEIVVADEALHGRLRAARGPEEFVALAVRPGFEHDCVFTAAVVEAGLHERRRGWMERWV